VIHEFFEALEKQAISAGRTLALLTARAGQGARVAPKLMQQAQAAAAQGLSHTPAAVRRTALGAGESAALARRSAAMPQRVGLGAETSAMRGRVADAVKAEAAGGATRSNVPLSKAYEGYMTSAQTAYAPKHTAQVMGVRPDQVKLRSGPTALMKQVGPSGTVPGYGTGSLPSSATVPARRMATPASNPGATVPARRAPKSTGITGVEATIPARRVA
jgi:hypothetical protein